jgi:hypothetical protein
LIISISSIWSGENLFIFCKYPSLNIYNSFLNLSQVKYSIRI